jgi:hypothetical protein
MNTLPQKESPPFPWPLLPVILLCLPGGCFGLLWFIYQFVDEGSIAHSQLYDVLIYFFALMVSGFGKYLLGLALIFWLILAFSKGQIRIKVIALALLLLACLGTLKFGWVLGWRH